MLRRTSHLMLEVIVGVAAVTVLVVAGALWRLSQGPVSVAALTPYFEEMLQQGPATKVKMRDTVLIWPGWNKPVDLRAVGVTARGPDGKLIAAVPELSIKLSFRALIRGEFQPTKLEILNPVVRLVRSKNGKFQIGMGEKGAPSASDLGVIVNALLKPATDRTPLRYLREVRLVDGALAVDDRRLQLSWGAPRFQFRVSRAEKGLNLEFDLQTDLDGQTPRFKGSAVYSVAREEADVEMSFLDFWPARLAGKAAAFRYLKYADIPLQGSVGFRVRSDGTFVTGAADLVAGPGQIVAPGVLRGPVKVRGMKLRATLKPSPERFVLEELEADLGGPSLSAKAVMTVVGGLANVSSDIAIRDLPAKDIAKIWPIGVSSNGRDWVKKNITDGQVRLASVRLITQARLEDGTVNVSSVSGALDVEDLAIHYFRPLKPVRGVKARARFGPDLLDFKVTRGNLAGVRVEGGSVRISGFSSVTQQLAVNLSLDGPLTNYLQTLDHPKLGYISAIGLVPGTVGGAAQTRLTVNLPLIEALKFAQVDLRAKSEMSDVSVPAILMDQDLTVGRLALNLDLKGMTLTGDAKIADVPAKVILQRHFRDTKEFVALSRVQATLQPKELSRFGLDVDPVVTGPMVWDVSLTEREDRTKELTGSVDLSPATMSISFLNWSKPPGEAGNARFFIQLDPKKPPNLERFELTGGGLKVAGTARFGVADGWPLVSARIETFTLGQTNLKATLKRSPTGASAIAITGEVFDAGPLMEPTEPDPEPKGPKATQALAVTASIDRVLLGKGRVLPRLSGRASYDGRRWRDLDISTQLDAGKDASITIATAKGRQSILIRSNDAGVLLRRLKIVDSIKGGRLFVGGDRSFTTANDPWSGKALIKDFQLVKAPILAQVLTLASLTGIGNTLRGEGIKFSRLEVPFSYDGDIVTIKGARSVGSQLGLTGDGEVDLGQDSIRFKGTIVPAYTLNSLLSNIPIIREIFTGSSKAGSGVFAVNYGVSGKTEKPKVKVNPLSVLAPGFLRNLVEVMTSGEPGKDVKPEAPPDD